MAIQKWEWGSVTDQMRGGWQEFIRLCNTRFRDLSVLLRQIQAGLFGWVTPEQYGAKGNGISDDTLAVQAAVNAAGTKGVVFFRQTYRTTSAITVSVAGQKWIMTGYLNGKILKAHTGNGVTVTGAGFAGAGVTIDADVASSATYAQGSAIAFNAGSNFPELVGFHTLNIDIGLDFGADGGKYFHGVNGVMDPYTQTVGAEGRCIYLRGTDTTAMHRRFVNCVGQGIVDFGAAFDTLIANCIFRRPVWSSASASITFLDNCVWGSLGTAMTIDGENTVVRGCRFAGNVTLAATMSGVCGFADNIQTSGTFTDSTAVNVCMVRHHPLATNYHLIDKHKIFSASTTGGVVRTYRRVAPGDADYTWSPTDGVSEVDYTTTLTATRTITLSSANAENSVGGLVRRTAGGAFLLNVGGLINLAPDEWCCFAWSGSAYYITSSGRYSTGGNLDRGLNLTVATNSGTTQYGQVVDAVSSSAATANGIGLYARAQTAAAAFTQGFTSSLYAANPAKGSGSTITNAVGLLIEAITNGASNFSIRTSTGRAFFGDNISVRSVDYIWPAAGAAGQLTNDGANNLSWTAGGSGAPTGASYLTLGLDGTLTAERVLTEGTNLTFTDTGAGGTLTVALDVTEDVQFNQFEGLQFVVENRTSDPGAPVTGQLWIRTDL